MSGAAVGGAEVRNMIWVEKVATVPYKMMHQNHNDSALNRHEHYTFVAEGAEKRGELKPGGTVVEYTGGSTGSSLAMVCANKGYPAHWRCFNLSELESPHFFANQKSEQYTKSEH